MDAAVIRQATEADLDRIGELWEQLVKYHTDLDARMPVIASNGREYYIARLSTQLLDPTIQALVAEINGAVVGYVLGAVVDIMPIMFVREKSGLLADIFVEAAYRGKGIGRELVFALAASLRTQGVQHMEWQVATSNPDGIAFWRAMGGQDIMLRMRREL